MAKAVNKLTDVVRSPHARVTEPQSTPRRSRNDPARKKRIARTLNEIPDNQLACRSGRHDWPMDRLQVGRALPKGLRAVPYTSGQYQLVDECQRCGKTRTITTLSDRSFDVDASYVYADPKEWVTLHEDLEVTKRDLRAENIRRNADRLFG